MEVAFTQKVTLSPEALFQEVGGEIVILDLKSETYFGLDEVGARIWQLMEEHGDMQKVYEAILDEFDVESGRLQADMTALFDELAKSGLISADDE